MSYAALRKQFLDYFHQRDHQIVASSSLIPADDPSLLFTNAGMNQFKNVFLGIENPSAPRVTTAQRCVRAGGKHNDLENVGYTARHHTFFEMLGNFSFGDYFKKEAIEYAWIFVTEHLNLSKDRLWITVHHQDDESESLWHHHIGVPMNRIVRCSDKDNYWSMGDCGPCGPCTEIFYDQGPSIQGGPPGSPEAEGDRYMEIWNLVFMQYDRQSDGSLLPLPNPCVDTGMGLERLACVSEGVCSNFDTSLFKALKKPIALRTKSALNDPRLNVIADHLRAATFIIADGMTPSAEGRGYVLRRLIRRALSHGYQLGLKTPFLFEYVPIVVSEMSGAYPFLLAQNTLCQDVISREEQLFHHTLHNGLKYVHKALAHSNKIIKGSDLFQLYDTYGFPIDISRDIAKEHNLELDQAGFEECMQRQKMQSKDQRALRQWTVSELPAAEQAFLRDQADVSTAILAAYADVDDRKSWLCLERNVFYAESGGQVGDTGVIVSSEGSVNVLDTQKAHHLSMILTDVPADYWIGVTQVQATINSQRRQKIASHHTATHLIHAALHHVIGSHVRQRGSHVGPDRLRFDIAYDKPLSAQQRTQIEEFCQKHIDGNALVHTESMTMEAAVEAGAIAFFEDKYGASVRVLSIGEGVSKELCGGTHVDSLSPLMTIILLSDEPLSSGVRRIQAVSGTAALSWLKDRSDIVHDLTDRLRIAPNQIVKSVYDLQGQCGDLKQALEDFRKKNLFEKLRAQIITSIAGYPFIVCALTQDDKPYLNEATDYLFALATSKAQAGLTLCLWIQEEQKYTLLLAQNGVSSLPLDKVVQTLKNTLKLKGGGRAQRVQLGGVVEGDFEQQVLTLLHDLQP